ncbi:hypothetical protein [Methylosinus sp. Sm6]|uniref:hypothetical protein n=1 Tax=Methylosinus sp. Sm6 TaxID=2866948 RepID=UPI001C9A14BF|nr:hypothetical protein [Methylosinus sp. Sm6]MBY6239673.1 hypothetical protein [Methylosinus sp. Sm6]
MLFNIEADRGNRIVGYVAPDEFTKSPTLRVTSNGVEVAQFVCKDERPALVAAGRHATGCCGFTIDASIVPDIANNDTLELTDVDTGIVIYRRRKKSQVLDQSVFRLETHLFPLWRLDEQVEHKFQYFHKGVERHGRETAMQVFNLTNASSLYLSGRLAFSAYQSFLHDRFKCVALLHDPYVELAERLLTLKHVAKFGDDLLGPRDMLSFNAAIEFAQQIDDDDRRLRRAFDQMQKNVIALLANPLTRQLASEDIDDPPPRTGVAKALAALATFAVVGVRDRSDAFLEAVEALLKIPPGALSPLPRFAAVEELGARLRHMPEVELLLEDDLEIYYTAKAAIEEAT